MTNKEFTNLLNQEYNQVFEIINQSANSELNKTLGAFTFAARVTDNNYAQITALYNIMKKYPGLSNEQITLFVKGKKSFRFLEKFISFSPTALDDLKFHGPIKMSQDYSSVAIHKQAEKRRSKPKPKSKQKEEELYDDGIFVDDTDYWMR